MRALAVFLALFALGYLAWSSRGGIHADGAGGGHGATANERSSAPSASFAAGPARSAHESPIRLGAGPAGAHSPDATRRAVDASTDKLRASIPALVFEVDGDASMDYRALWLAESCEVVGTSGPHADGRLPVTDFLAARVLLARDGRRSAIVEVERDLGQDLVVRALPTHTIVGNVVEAASGSPVTDATVQARAVTWHAEVEAWLAENGVVRPSQVVVDGNGRFSLGHLTPGEYTLRAVSPAHLASEAQAMINGDVDLGPVLTLAPRPRLAVRLAGAAEQRAGAYAAHTILGTKAWVDDGGLAQVLLDPDVEALDIAVGLSDGCELTAFLQGSAADYPDGVTIPVGGRAGVEVGFTGATPVEDRLLALVYFVAQDGHEVFANRFVEVGERALFACCEPGTIWVDAAVKRADRSPLTLARRGVTVAPGEVGVVTIELPDALRYVRLLDSGGAPVPKAEVWFTTGAEGHLATPGGAVDADGRIVLPDMDAAMLWLSGATGPANDIAFMDLPLNPRAAGAGDVDIPLGAVERTRLQLIERGPGGPVEGEWVRCTGRITGHVGAEGASGADGTLLLQWHASSDAVVQLDPERIWSPRGPIPLVAGELRVAVERRAWCQLRTGGRLVQGLEREGRDTTRALLEADPSVRYEKTPTGERWWGLPAGRYRVQLEGEDSWRGPFEVVAGEWTTIELE